MDETVLKISLAAFLHDIGKFADKQAMGISEDFLNKHADLYQPAFKGQYSHAHAVYTVAFIENLSELLPPECNQPQWGEGDSFINLAASHHRPETPLQWIIALADRVSSGWDRETFDQEYNYQIPWKDYKKTRLVPIFEQLRVESEMVRPTKEGFTYHYALRPLSPGTIFPVVRSEDAEISLIERELGNIDLIRRDCNLHTTICTSSKPPFLEKQVAVAEAKHHSQTVSPDRRNPVSSAGSTSAGLICWPISSYQAKKRAPRRPPDRLLRGEKVAFVRRPAPGGRTFSDTAGTYAEEWCARLPPVPYRQYLRSPGCAVRWAGPQAVPQSGQQFNGGCS
ncbi:MAG: HD domain-containing protein [Deltaproteobacteria bacterium]|nr:HD domain-containing protein [Deltaproteobacteria bacterium]